MSKFGKFGRFNHINDRIAFEETHAKFEQHKLSDYSLQKIREMPKMADALLLAAAKFKDHEGEVGHVGRAAFYECVKRGLLTRS